MFSLETLPSTLFVALMALSMVPFFVIMTTAFVKLAVVMLLLRNALGVQGIPPNMALYGMASILTVYIMAPVGRDAYEIVVNSGITFENMESVANGFQAVAEPFRQFLIKHADETEKLFFLDTAETLWPAEDFEVIDANSMLILIPAFAISELSKAFEVGFLLYLPFVIIDLIVSNILLAMGMMMVSPTTVSLPFKLLLFVLVDGWARLLHGLVLTYQ